MPLSRAPCTQCASARRPLLQELLQEYVAYRGLGPAVLPCVLPSERVRAPVASLPTAGCREGALVQACKSGVRGGEGGRSTGCAMEVDGEGEGPAGDSSQGCGCEGPERPELLQQQQQQQQQRFRQQQQQQERGGPAAAGGCPASEFLCPAHEKDAAVAGLGRLSVGSGSEMVWEVGSARAREGSGQASTSGRGAEGEGQQDEGTHKV